jgi:hypothetical protein
MIEEEDDSASAAGLDLLTALDPFPHSSFDIPPIPRSFSLEPAFSARLEVFSPTT